MGNLSIFTCSFLTLLSALAIICNASTIPFRRAEGTDGTMRNPTVSTFLAENDKLDGFTVAEEMEARLVQAALLNREKRQYHYGRRQYYGQTRSYNNGSRKGYYGGGYRGNNNGYRRFNNGNNRGFGIILYKRIY
ncbi:uncharacterized protein LOC118437742 [Folsomia candida]|uniref:Uncharacterized protein n=1 Tax=Folsomia candida TaxID=158441 RepID=A0A226DL53_FOLCA|nr:uncharacterized protein LOC118437742 [Folsomia candida]OXA46272.1 hypothetical protein Fcan01_18971 [Folsomia candida]